MALKSALCGFLAGDGSVQVRKEKTFFHYQLDFFPDDLIMMKKYIEFIKVIYSKRPSIRIRDNVFQVRLTSKMIVTDLLEYSNFGLYTWNLPYSLFNFPLAKEYWLKAFFSAEAYVNKNGIKVQTVNKDGMIKVSKLLFDLNIDHNLYFYSSKKENYSGVSIITINKKEARINYFNRIGFWHSKKENLLKKSLAL